MNPFISVRRFQLVFIFVLVLAILLGLGQLQSWKKPDKSQEIHFAKPVVSSIKEPIQPIPLNIDLNPNKVVLGERLFNEPKLSHDNTVACVTCHSLKTGGADRLVHSIGINGAIGAVNTPTVFNSGFNFRQFWDGRAATLEDQIEGPTTARHEMGSNWEEVIAKLKTDPGYVATFSKLYQTGITRENIKDSLATYIRSLYTPNSRFDRYLRGDMSAITPQEKEGYRLFKEYGCVSCHQGVNVGGNLFQKFGVLEDYFANRGNLTDSDRGLANVTGDSSDMQVFKVPSLRNVELTPPYFHDGLGTTLEEAVSAMAKYQLGRQLSQTEINSIVQFLKTLTGEYQGKPLSL